jgi:uncharacterized protein (TIRG00374 family)
MHQRWTRLVLSFGLSLFFLYLTFFIPSFGAMFRGELGIGQALFGHPRFDIVELGHVIASANWNPISLAGVLFAVSLFLRAWRWRLMLRPLVEISFHDVFAAMCIGYMANDVLPLRMGEVYRAQVVYQISGLSRSAAFGNIVLERVVDLVSMIPFLGLALLLFPVPGFMRDAAILTAFASFLMAGFLIWLVVDTERALRIAERFLRIFPKKFGESVIALLEKFASGLLVLKKSQHLFGLIVSSLGLWTLYAGMAYFILDSLKFFDSNFVMIDQNPLGAVLVTLMFTTIGFAIPGAPGGVGTYHGMAVLGLSLFDVPGDRAAGFAVLLHVLNVIPLTILGLFFFWKLGLNFKDSRRLVAETKEVVDHSTAVDSSEPATSRNAGQVRR